MLPTARLVAATLIALPSSVSIAETVKVEPGSSISHALDQPNVQELVLLPGRHFLEEPIVLGPEHSGLLISGDGAVISGGMQIQDWEPDPSAEGLWSAPVAFHPRQLFSTELGRLQRSRIPNHGYLRGDKLSDVDFDVNRNSTRDLVNGWRQTHPQLFAGLRYRESDPVSEVGEGAVLQALGAWESSWHPIRSIDAKTRDIQLFTPSRYPLAHWSYGINDGGGTPFAIENSAAGLDLPGEWYFNPVEGRIVLLLDEGEEPKPSAYVAARLPRLLEIAGADEVRIRGLSFAHSAYEVGIYDQHKTWPEPIRAIDPTFPESFPDGLAVPQSAPFTGAAILIRDSDRCLLEACQFRDCGGYAIEISRGCQGIRVIRSQFAELGAGGINIDPGTTNLEPSQLPSENEIAGCRFTRGGLIHPAAVAIRIANSPDNRILHNEISHFGYSGISVGWAWNPRPNPTTGNLIRGNHIHHVMGTLSDGAGIYTLGAIPGTVIEGNYIHDIERASTAIGAGNSGIFFDQYSKGARVERNVIRRTPAYHERDRRPPHPIKHNLNQPEDHSFAENDVDAGDSPIRLLQVIDRAGPKPAQP